MHDNVYLLSAVPLTNFFPDISHFGGTIPRGVTADIGIAQWLTLLALNLLNAFMLQC